MRTSTRTTVQFLIALLLCALLSAAAGAQAYFAVGHHSMDTDADWQVSISELLRVIQLYNVGAYHPGGGDDGYEPGAPPPWREGQGCPHDLDAAGGYWNISLSELLRGIQLYNSPAYHMSPGSEDGFAPGAGPVDAALFVWRPLEAAVTAGAVIQRARFNDDTVDDVMVVDPSLGLTWWECDGHGNFVAHLVDAAVSGATRIDIDDDGDQDILGPNDPALGTAWWENDGQGGFVKRLIAGATVTPGIVGDFDADGGADVLEIGHTSYPPPVTNYWWRNEPETDFTQVGFEVDASWDSGYPESWRFVAAADLNGDGYSDIVGLYWDVELYEAYFWYRNNGDNTFTWMPLTLACERVDAAVPADLDGDALPDLTASLTHGDDAYGMLELPHGGITWDCVWHEMRQYINLGIGEFDESRILMRIGTSATFSPVLVCDLDADGDQDVLITGFNRGAAGTRSLGWLERRGNDQWAMRSIAAVTAVSLAADFNGDRFPDLFGINESGALGWWDNRLGKSATE